MSGTVIRFLVGGTVVCLFALLGDVLRPKGFAGLFAGAPSVALATLSLAAFTQGAAYAGVEARSMMVGAVGLILYCACCVYLLALRHARTARTVVLALPLWAIVVGALYWGMLAA